MVEIEQAHHELGRLQEIITRHEGFIFTIRQWLLTVIAGLLAAYYTENIDVPRHWMWIGLPGIALLFLLLESRHANLVESVVERASAIEASIVKSRQPGADLYRYDGPQVSASCLRGVRRWWPRPGMTFLLNRAFYVIVMLIVVAVILALPEKLARDGPTGSAVERP